MQLGFWAGMLTVESSEDNEGLSRSSFNSNGGGGGGSGARKPVSASANPAPGGAPPLRAAGAAELPTGQPPRGHTPSVDAPAGMAPNIPWRSFGDMLGRGGWAADARPAAVAPAAALAGAADGLRSCLVGLLGERPYDRRAVKQARTLSRVRCRSLHRSCCACLLGLGVTLR